jgi:hypothetical protein
MAVACFGIGTIAQPVFGLGFVDSILAILFPATNLGTPNFLFHTAPT